MNPPQGAGFPPPGPHGQGNQPQARTPAGAYQMMYVPVVQYPGQQQQQQQQQWTPHGGGTVPMMMAQGQVMMAVPQGRWGAPAAAGWAAQMQQHYGQQQQPPPQPPQQPQQQQWFGTVGGGPPPPPPPPPASDVHPAPSSPSTNPAGGKRNRNRGKNRSRGGKPADPPSRSKPDADEGAAPPSDSVPAQQPEPTPAFKREKGVTFPTVDEIPAVKQVDVASLPEDVRRYREERAKNWPSRAVVERRQKEAEERAARGQLSSSTTDAAAAAAARRAALREILAKQRELGHFEASEEIGDVGGGAGDEEAGFAAAAGGGGNRKGKGRGGRDPDAGGDDSAPAKRSRRDAGAGARRGTRTCRYWQLGKCRRGDACDFVHEGDAGGNRTGPPSTGAEICPTISPTNAATNATPCRFFLRGRCKSGRRCAFAHDESAREKARAAARDKKAKASTLTTNGGGDQSQTLLRKLLAREVRVDRSRLLQVFRFLVNNDFLRGHDPSRPGDLWMFPWVDDPVRSPKETLRALAAEAAGDGEEPSIGGEEPSMEEDEETDGEADAEAGVHEEDDV